MGLAFHEVVYLDVVLVELYAWIFSRNFHECDGRRGNDVLDTVVTGVEGSPSAK